MSARIVRNIIIGIASVFSTIMLTSWLWGEDDNEKTITLPDGVKLKMIKVEGGAFEMNGKSVSVKDFYIGETEITQKQYKAVTGANPSYFKGDDRPVDSVEWADAKTYCDQLNKVGKAPKGWSFSLPSEAQWEYAARGGKKSRGYVHSGGNDFEKVEWYIGNSGQQTHPVKKKKGNELGLYDMSGNVMEWCLEEKEEGKWFWKETVHVLRGGCWGLPEEDCRIGTQNKKTTYIFRSGPSLNKNGIGFRIVLLPTP